jgi:hypothetical protein
MGSMESHQKGLFIIPKSRGLDKALKKHVNMIWHLAGGREGSRCWLTLKQIGYRRISPISYLFSYFFVRFGFEYG